MCAPKTMLKIGAVIVAAFALGWFAFPQVRTNIVALAPFAIVLICPLAMLFGGYGMHRMGRGETKQHSDCCTGHIVSSTEKEKA